MPLPPEALPAVPHIVFSFFNLAVPDLIALGIDVIHPIQALARGMEPGVIPPTSEWWARLAMKKAGRPP